MKKIAGILCFMFILNTYVQGQVLNFSNIVIKDKEYFACYLNPFGRMGNTVLRELNWEVGNYDTTMIMQDISAVLYRPSEDSTKFILLFINGCNIASTTFLTTISNNKLNEGELQTTHEINDALSCNVNGNHYYQIENGGLNMYYKDKLGGKRLIFTMQINK